MKVTTIHFEKFKASFLLWQKELGMVEYDIRFKLSDLQEGTLASIDINHEARFATAMLASTVMGNNIPDYTPDKLGKHEAIHLFISRITSLAHSRYLMRREIDDAEEGIVQTLEKLL